MTLLHELGSPLIRRALVEACLVGALCGVVGVHVLLRKLPFFTLALSHATLPGVVVASMLGLSLYLGGAAGALVLMLGVAAVGSAKRLDNATATGVALSAAFAAGVLLQSSRPGADKDLAAFLVGDVLTVNATDLWVTTGIAVTVVTTLTLLHKDLVFSVFDPAGAAAAGYRLFWLELLLLSLVGLTVVTSIPAVGTILVVALLVALPLAARQWVDRLVPMMAVAAGLGVGTGVLGMVASTQWGIAAGASMVLCATGLLGASVVLAAARRARATRFSGPGAPPVLTHSHLPD